MDYNDVSSGVLTGIGTSAIIGYLFFLVLTWAGLWKMFEKAGKPGWASIIPIYNLIVLIEIVGKPMIWIVWLIIPCVNIIFAVWITNLLFKSFGKSEAYTIGSFFVPFIVYPLVGFGDSKYLGPSAREANGGFGPYNGFGAKNPFNQPPNPPQL